jgi:hypothetical protein
MPSAAEAAVSTYIALAGERDPAVRATMIEACWAIDGRPVSTGGELRGRAALAEVTTRLLADPEWS